MRVAIREQLAALVLFAVLLSLAIISIPTWIFVHNFVVGVESDGLALTASLKASEIASELELGQTICATIASRILLQQAFSDFYNKNSSNPFAKARADLESAMGVKGGINGVLQARLYSRNTTGGDHGGLLSVTGAGVGNATDNIVLPYTAPDGSRVNLSDTEYGYPLSLYPNITYTSLGYPNPYVPTTPAFGAYAFPNVNLSTGGGLVLGPLVINETFALISLTIPVRSYAISGFILGYMTLVLAAGSLSDIQSSPEGLGSTGIVLIVGPANPSNRFNVSQPASNDTYSPTQASFKNTPVRFVIPPVPKDGQPDRHSRRNYMDGNWYARPFPLNQFPSLTKVYTRKLSPLDNSTVDLSTTNEQGVPVAVGVARPATTLVNWAVVVEKAKSEAYEPIDKLRDILLGCVFGTAGLVAILIFPCAHLSVMSIRRLKSATEKSINPPGYDDEFDDAFDEENPSSGATSSKRSDRGFFATIWRRIFREKKVIPISEADAHRHVFKIPGRVEVGCSSDPSAKASTSTSNGNSLSTANPTSPVAPTPGSRHLDSTQPRVTPGSSTSATAGSTTTATGAASTGDSNHFPGALGTGPAPAPGPGSGTVAVSPGSISPSASTPIPASAPASSTPAPAPGSTLTSTTSPLPASDQQQASSLASALATAAAARDPATAAPPTAAPDQDRQQPAMNPVNVQPPHSYAPGHDSQNLPSISNLINSPQNDGSTNGYPPSPYQNSAAVGSQMADQNAQLQQQQLLQQQQQQHLSSEMQLDPPHQQQQQPPQQQQQQQQQQQAPQPQQQQQQQPQQHHQIHHGHSVSLSQPRVTKGKYSLGDFEILRTLGTGSFGRVHLVQSKHNQRFYAVKVLKKAQVVKMKQVEHTNDERRMLSDVKHPFLITLWGTFQDWKNLYMVMDFVEGGELFSLLRKSGRFPNPVAKFYAAEATLALEYLHSKNIIYRDLKPENLLLDRHGHLKITDFGFAKRVPDKTWTLCGTPDYLAPEVVSNKGYNKSVDWWSLGILIYEMLCGYTPFWDSGSPMRIYENILKGKVKYPAYINPDAQNLLERLITADLTKRLGNLFGGSQDVRNHPWFAEVTWDRLARKDIDAPYTPPVKAGAGDASQFDRYPEDPEKYGGPGGHDEYGNLFTEF